MLTYSLVQTTAPTVEPVTVPELKDHLRVSGNSDDARLSNLIAVARSEVERRTGRSLITQHWTLTFDDWPVAAIVLPHAPLQSVTSIKYIDVDGDQQTWSSDEYVVDTYSTPGLVRQAYLCDWPDIRGDARGLEVVYVTGYGDAATDVPQSYRQAVMLRAELEYDTPTPELAAAYDRLVSAHTVGGYP